MPIEAPGVIPTIDDLKTHLNITSAVHDDELIDMLAAAVDTVESYVGPLEGSAKTETHYGLSTAGPILLRHTPVVSVTSVTHADGTPYAVSDYELHAEAGLLHLGYAGSYSRWSGQITVSYVAGRNVIPSAIRIAILIVAARLWETQRGNAPGARRPEPDEFGGDPGALPLLPPRARELLAPYLSAPSIA